MPILLSEPNPLWPSAFDEIRTTLATALHELPITRIEHVGSTSIPNLPAKPVIDIDIIVRDVDIVPSTIGPLQSVGYLYCGERGIADRHFFRYATGADEVKRNVYVVVEGSTALRNHLAVREVLRRDESLRNEYADVKRDLADKYDDVDSYCEGKTEFLLRVLRKAGLSEVELEEIRKSNVS